MEKVGPGIYISKDVLEDEAYVLSQRCPKGVISHDDALYYYGLVDREPFVHCITIYSGYNPSALTNSGYKVYTVKKELLDSTLRFSFGLFNTKEEIDYCMDVLKELLPVLRRYYRA